jgi:hypothetical protein
MKNAPYVLGFTTVLFFALFMCKCDKDLLNLMNDPQPLDYTVSVAITEGPEGETTETQPTFKFRGACAESEIIGYYISVDDPSPNDFLNSSSYTPVKPLELGPHVFYVSAKAHNGPRSAVICRCFIVVEDGGGGEPEETVVDEDFSDGALDPLFELENAGICSWSIESGLLKMEQGGYASDAGLVILHDNLNVSMPMTIKTKVRFSNPITPGWYGYSRFAIGQEVDAPGILRGFDGQIHIAETPEGNLRIHYETLYGELKCWNNSAEQWEPCDPSSVSYYANPGDYYIVEFISDGTEWAITLKDESENVLAQTSLVAWSQTNNDGVPYKFYFGEWSTGYYSVDMDVDSIYVRYTPQ